MAASKPVTLPVVGSSRLKTWFVFVPPILKVPAFLTALAHVEAETSSSEATGPELMIVS